MTPYLDMTTMLLAMLQAAAEAGSKELYAVIGIGITTIGTVAAQWVTAHRKGKSRSNELATSLSSTLSAHIDRKLMPLDIKLDSLAGEVRDLTAHVIGPDGKNGLRGDLRKLEGRMDGVEEREREAIARSVGMLDRRTGT